MKLVLRENVLEAEQFIPSNRKMPKGISDVYHMGNQQYTGAIWVKGKRIGIVSGDWVLYERHGIPVNVVKPDEIADYVKVEINTP